MAERRPLVVIDGVVQELPDGDTLPGGWVVKSVQRGKTSTSSSAAVAIAEVNPAKTMLNLLTSYSYAVPNQSSNSLAQLELTNGTTLTVRANRSSNSTTALEVSWEVVEFY